MQMMKNTFVKNQNLRRTDIAMPMPIRTFCAGIKIFYFSDGFA
jgi:hypothetical protein